MRVSTERLMQGVVDYAGSFPPARLSTPESLLNYVRCFSGPDRWVLGRYACSTSRLGELADAIGRTPESPMLAVAAIGRASEDRHSWEAALTDDAEAMNRFHDRVGDRAEIESYEIRIPSPGNPEFYLNDLVGFRDADIFAEIPLSEAMDDILACLAETEWLGAKARTGGLDASAFPDAGALAGFLRSCVDLDLPFKLTAGLHQPFAHFDEALQANSHGFISVLGATALAISEDLSRHELTAILIDREPTSWEFDDLGLSWNGRRADLEAIHDARQLFTAFGSCSVEEPLAALQSL